MPTVITVIAANALPMIIVNSIMPTPNTMMPIVTLPLGMMPPTSAVATADTMMIRIASSLRANPMITMTIPATRDNSVPYGNPSCTVHACGRGSVPEACE